MLADEGLENRRQAQLRRRRSLLLGARLAEVDLGLLLVDDLGQVDRRRVGAQLTLHAGWLPVKDEG